MALIKGGRVADDTYVSVADDAALPNAPAIIVSLKRWQAEKAALSASNAAIGVLLPSDTSPDTLKDDLTRLSLVAIAFPTFRDGRGYSWARMLRTRLGFKGELRAVGQVFEDQAFFMNRVGFDSFEPAEGQDLAGFLRALHAFAHVYQPAADKRATILEERAKRGG